MHTPCLKFDLSNELQRRIQIGPPTRLEANERERGGVVEKIEMGGGGDMQVHDARSIDETVKIDRKSRCF